MLEGKTSFGPDDVTISEFSQLLALSSNQRKSFYRAMRKTKLSQKSEKVKDSVKIILVLNRVDVDLTKNTTFFSKNRRSVKKI